jgi:replicative DNA helicase
MELIVLRELFRNETYCRRVLPFIELDYFTEKHEKIIFLIGKKIIDKYNKMPSKESLVLAVSALTNINDDTEKNILKTLDTIFIEECEVNLDILTDNTEIWCKERALDIALTKAIEIRSDNKVNLLGQIPEILKDAISVSFDSSIGHDYIDDSEERFLNYTKQLDKIPFSLKSLNDITNGGVERKTLNCVAGAIHSGKSMFMCFLAAQYLLAGYNVVYITLELSEYKVAERIDANLLKTNIGELPKIAPALLQEKLNKIKTKKLGKLKIKQYPTSSAHVGHFRHLLSELELKKDFKTDIVFVDYLSICASTRAKFNNSYEYVKNIGEEIRGLAIEKNIVIFTGAQFSKQGFNSDPDITNTAESMGLPAILDFYIAAVRTEELDKENKIMFKQLKNRYADLNNRKRFIIGIDFPKMTYYDVEDTSMDFLNKQPAPEPIEKAVNSFKKDKRNKVDTSDFKL